MGLAPGRGATAEPEVFHPSDGPVVDDGELASPARLRAVAAVGLLDTGDEPSFDRWALRATELTESGTALLSLVDQHRSYFKSFRRSDGSAGEGREVPISMSLCREVVVRGESLIVGDATSDPRTCDYGAVAAFPVGAYAGMPLCSEDGQVLGSFCVVDPEPRPWTPDQLAALADLTAAVQSELQLRAAARQNGRHAALMDTHLRVHALMLDGAPRLAVLAEFIAGVELQVDRMRGSIVLTEDLVRVPAPDGPTAEAARSGCNVIAADLASDERWPELRTSASDSGPVSCWAVPIRGSDGFTLGALSLWGDHAAEPFADDLSLLYQASRMAAIILERFEASVELSRLATTDPLTGLPNRAWLLDRLGDRLRAEPDGRELAVLFCDLDHFKLINDTHGHQAGDAVLIEIARRLTALVRPGDLVARLGGDEFVIVPADVHDLESAATCAARLEHAIAAPIDCADGSSHAVRASLGIALVKDVSAGEAIQRSDLAMYDVKRDSRRGGS